MAKVIVLLFLVLLGNLVGIALWAGLASLVAWLAGYPIGVGMAFAIGIGAQVVTNILTR